MGLLAEDPAREARVCSFTGVVCAACPAIEELTARDTLIASLREGNEALRVKVAALAEIAFGGSERRGGKGRDADEELGDRDDDSSGADSSGAEGDLRAPGPVTDDSADGEGAAGSGWPRPSPLRSSRGASRRRRPRRRRGLLWVLWHGLRADRR